MEPKDDDKPRHDKDRHPDDIPLGSLSDRAEKAERKYDKYRPSYTPRRGSTEHLTEEYQVRNGTYWRFSNRKFPLGSVPNDYLSNDQLEILKSLKEFPDIQDFLTRMTPERWLGVTTTTTHFEALPDVKVMTIELDDIDTEE